jgi:hypothetical protein
VQESNTAQFHHMELWFSEGIYAGQSIGRIPGFGGSIDWPYEARAETALGSRFDTKEFHDVILLGGAMPLSVLDQRVNTWLAKKAAK